MRCGASQQFRSPMTAQGQLLSNGCPTLGPNVFNRIGGPCVVTASVRVGRYSDAPTAKLPPATAASRGAMDLDPPNAIAISTTAKIDPKMAFACSHRSNVCRPSADSLL